MNTFNYHGHLIDLNRLVAVAKTGTPVDMEASKIVVVRTSDDPFPILVKREGKYEMIAGQLAKKGDTIAPYQKGMRLLATPVLKRAVWVEPERQPQQPEPSYAYSDNRYSNGPSDRQYRPRNHEDRAYHDRQRDHGNGQAPQTRYSQNNRMEGFSDTSQRMGFRTNPNQVRETRPSGPSDSQPNRPFPPRNFR
jgi:hypothetical protein